MLEKKRRVLPETDSLGAETVNCWTRDACAGVGQLALIRLTPDAGDVSITNRSWTMSHRSASMSPTEVMKSDLRRASRNARNIMADTSETKDTTPQLCNV